jgi:hypothetical protein
VKAKKAKLKTLEDISPDGKEDARKTLRQNEPKPSGVSGEQPLTTSECGAQVQGGSSECRREFLRATRFSPVDFRNVFRIIENDLQMSDIRPFRHAHLNCKCVLRHRNLKLRT